MMIVRGSMLERWVSFFIFLLSKTRRCGYLGGVMVLLHDVVRDTVGLHSPSLSAEALGMAVEKICRVGDTHEMKLFVIWP